MDKALICLRAMCHQLQMDFALDEDREFIVARDCDGINRVINPSTGLVYDDRGDLFIALRNLAVQMVPNVLFRTADYIYNK